MLYSCFDLLIGMHYILLSVNKMQPAFSCCVSLWIKISDWIILINLSLLILISRHPKCLIHSQSALLSVNIAVGEKLSSNLNLAILISTSICLNGGFTINTYFLFAYFKKLRYRSNESRYEESNFIIEICDLNIDSSVRFDAANKYFW